MNAPQQALVGGSGGAQKVLLTSKTLTGADNGGVAAASGSTTFSLLATGVARVVNSGNTCNPPAGTTDYTPQWMLVGPSSLYECMATLSSGALTSGTVGSWLPCSANQSWNLAASVAANGGNVTKDAVIVVSIRLASGGQVLIGSGGIYGAGATITMHAEANSG